MLVEHRGAVPQVHPAAYIAPTAVLCGDVHVSAHCRVLFGAVTRRYSRALGQHLDDRTLADEPREDG